MWRFVFCHLICADFPTRRYLILPSTFDTGPSLRFSHGVLYIIIVALLTGGYSLTLLLWFACPSLYFRRDSIFLPTASASAFSFVATLYLFASSSSYSFSKPSGGITLGFTALSTIVYGLLAFFTSRRISQASRGDPGLNRAMTWQALTGTPSIYSNYSASGSAANTGTWMEPGYYQNFNANMHPTAYRGAHPPNDAPSTSSGPVYLPPTEDEMVNQQMAMLLTKKDTHRGSNASQTTFRLEWPVGDEEESDTISSRMKARMLRLATRQAFVTWFTTRPQSTAKRTGND